MNKIKSVTDNDERQLVGEFGLLFVKHRVEKNKSKQHDNQQHMNRTRLKSSLV